MRAISLIVLGLLSAAAPAFGDAGTTAAALPDEASECRYLDQLCADARQARKTYEAAVDKANAAARRHRAAADTYILKDPSEKNSKAADNAYSAWQAANSA